MKLIKKFLVSLVTFALVFTVGVTSMKPEFVLAASLSGADRLIALGMPDTLARYFASSLVSVNASGNLVAAVASGKKLSVTVAGTEEFLVDGSNVTIATNNLGVTAGSVTAGTTVTATLGNITATNGEFVSSTSGNTLALQEATSAAACMGTLTCNGASDVVTSTTCATTGSRIFLTRTSLDADTTGDFYVKSISNGVSFTVACELNDTGTLNWIIFHEAA